MTMLPPTPGKVKKESTIEQGASSAGDARSTPHVRTRTGCIIMPLPSPASRGHPELLQPPTRVLLVLARGAHLVLVLEQPPAGLLVQPLLVRHLAMALVAHLADEVVLGHPVELSELLVRVRLDVVRVDKVGHLEPGHVPLEDEGRLGRVEGHLRRGDTLAPAGKERAEKGEDEEKQDGEQADERGEATAGVFPLLALGPGPPARPRAPELVHVEALAAAKVENELGTRVEAWVRQWLALASRVVSEK